MNYPDRKFEIVVCAKEKKTFWGKVEKVTKKKQQNEGREKHNKGKILVEVWLCREIWNEKRKKW